MNSRREHGERELSQIPGRDGSEALVDQARGGDREALVQLLRLHDEDLRPIIQRRLPERWRHLIAADDIVQQTYADILAAPHLLPAASAFAAWLAQVAIRNLLDVIRALEADKRGGAPGIGPPELVESLTFIELLVPHRPGQSTPSGRMIKAEAVDALNVAMSRLPAAQRLVVQRYDLEGRPIQEVAAELGRSPGAVHVLRARAHDRLRGLLDGRSKVFPDSV